MSSSKIQSRNLDPNMDLAKESSVQSVLSAVKNSSGIFHMEYIEDVGLELQNLPVAIQRARTIIYNNEIHLLGGSDNPSIHYKYDGVKWMSVGTLPYKFQGGTAVVYNNEIHILGGNLQDSNTGILKYHYKYDGIKWTSVGTLPFEHYQVGENTIVYNNEIHVVGGYKSGTLKYHYKYNGSSWSSVSTLPIDAACPSVFLYNNEMHFIIATSHYKWNGSSWVSVGTLPFNCQAAQNQSIFIYENYIINYSGSAFYIFDGDSWKKGEWNLYRSATSASIEYFNGNVCMIGGQHGSNGSSLFSKLLSPSIQGYMIAGTKIYSNYLFKDTENSKFISDDCIEVTNNGFTIIEFSKQDAPFVIV